MAKQASKLIDPIEEALMAVEEAMASDVSHQKDSENTKDADGEAPVVSLAKGEGDAKTDEKPKGVLDGFELDLTAYEDDLKAAAMEGLASDNLLDDNTPLIAPAANVPETTKAEEGKKRGGIFSKIRSGAGRKPQVKQAVAQKKSDDDLTLNAVSEETAKQSGSNKDGEKSLGKAEAKDNKAANKIKDLKATEVKEAKDTKAIKEIKAAEEKTAKDKSQQKAEQSAVNDTAVVDDAAIAEQELLIEEQVAAIIGGSDAIFEQNMQKQAVNASSNASMSANIQAAPMVSTDENLAGKLETGSQEAENNSKALNQQVAEKPTKKAIEDNLEKSAKAEEKLDNSDDASKRKSSAEAILVSKMNPANDDEFSGLSHRMHIQQLKGSNALYWAAALFSLVWIGLSGLAGYQIFGAGLFQPAQWGANISALHLILFTAGLVIPIMLVWAFAVMVRRSQEMRSAVQVMTQAAQHLLEPEVTSSGAVMNVGQAVRREINAIQETVDQALSRASELESVMHNEVSLLERSYSENEMRMRGLIEQISNEREAVASQSEQVQAVISGTHANLREDLDYTTQMISQSVGQASEVLRTTVQESQQEISTSYSNVAKLFDETFKEKTGNLIASFSQNGEGLVEKIVQTSTSIQNEFELQSNSLTDRMTLLSQEVKGGLDENLSAIDETLNIRGNNLIESLETRSEKLESLLMNSQDDVTKVMDEQLTSFGLTISGKVEQIVGEMDTKTKILAENADKIDSILETRVKHVNDTLIERTRDVAGVFAQNQQAMNADVSQNIEKAVAALEMGREDLNNKFTENLTGLSVTVAAETERVNDVASQSVSKMGAQIQGLLENAENAIAIRTDHVSGKLEQSTRDLNAMLAERTRELNKVLKEDTIPVLEGLETKGQSIASTLTDASNKIGVELDSALERANADTDGFVAKISERSDEVVNKLSSIASDISDRGVEVTTQVDQISQKLADNFDNATNKAAENIAKLAEDTNDKLTKVSEDTNDKLVGTVEAFANHVADGSQLLSDKLERATENAAERLSSITENTNSKLVGSVQSFTDRVSEGSQLLSSHVERVAETATENFSKSTQHLSEQLAHLNSEAGRSTEDVAMRIAKTTEYLTQRLNETSQGATDQLLNASQQSVERLQHVADETLKNNEVLATQVASSVENAVAHLSQEKHEFVEAISSQANSATAAITNTKAALREEIESVLEQVSHSNNTLHQLISGAGSKLSQIHKDLDEKTMGFQNAAYQVQTTLGQATEGIEEKFKTAKSTSNSIAHDMANIGERFNQHSHQLESVASLMQRTQENLSSNIGGQQEMLEQLTSNMVAKSQEMEQMMRSFSHMINDAMTRAEQSTVQLSSGLSEEFMKTANEATTKFAQATEEMRSSALKVQQDLEHTRAELKRGIHDLPEETKESTTALRRAVSDQIKALKELSNYVSKTGNSVDVSQAIETNNLSSATMASSGFNPAIATKPAAPTAPLNAPQTSFSPIKDVAEPVKQEVPSFEQKEDTKSSSGSWVGDLLRRASDGDEEVATVPVPMNRAPEQLLDSMNAASVDLVKALDSKTSIELWKRYTGGERDVFTRALSSVDLARTKSLIQNKFNTDFEFKAALERYQSDFELLMRDLTEKNDLLAKERYEYSDHGRVYKILMSAIDKPSQL